MDRDTVKKIIFDIAKDVFSKSDYDFKEDTSAIDVDTWSSLTFMQFLTAIENRFEFKFKIFELLKLQNLGAVIDATIKHL